MQPFFNLPTGHAPHSKSGLLALYHTTSTRQGGCSAAHIKQEGAWHSKERGWVVCEQACMSKQACGNTGRS